MRNYRKYRKEKKEYLRSKHPYLSEFFKNLRIKEIHSEMEKKVKPLMLRYVESLTPNLDNLSLQEIYELKRLGKIPYSEYLKAQAKEIEIRNYPKSKKTKKPKIEKRTYFCEKHKIFHKHLFQGKPSKTYRKCLNSGNLYEFKENIDNYDLFKMDFKRKWKNQAKKQNKKRWF